MARIVAGGWFITTGVVTLLQFNDLITQGKRLFYGDPGSTDAPIRSLLSLVIAAGLVAIGVGSVVKGFGWMRRLPLAPDGPAAMARDEVIATLVKREAPAFGDGPVPPSWPLRRWLGDQLADLTWWRREFMSRGVRTLIGAGSFAFVLSVVWFTLRYLPDRDLIGPFPTSFVAVLLFAATVWAALSLMLIAPGGPRIESVEFRLDGRAVTGGQLALGQLIESHPVLLGREPPGLGLTLGILGVATQCLLLPWWNLSSIGYPLLATSIVRHAASIVGGVIFFVLGHRMVATAADLLLSFRYESTLVFIEDTDDGEDRPRRRGADREPRAQRPAPRDRRGGGFACPGDSAQFDAAEAPRLAAYRRGRDIHESAAASSGGSSVCGSPRRAAGERSSPDVLAGTAARRADAGGAARAVGRPRMVPRRGLRPVHPLGVYSQLARGEWVMQDQSIPIPTYEWLASSFNPVRFDAQEWVRLARSAGVRYITITSRHHDGFSMFATKATTYNIVDGTPFKRDPLKELADECQRQGIKLFFYYSQLDWHHPDYFPRGGTGKASGRPDSGDWTRYIAFMNQQLTELLTNYGPIGGIWFDGMWDKPDADWHLADTYALIHRLQPAALIVPNHHEAPLPGEDVQTFEQDLPGANTAGFNTTTIGTLPLETSLTMNKSWGFNITDRNWKTTQDLIGYLVRAAGSNANLLLNIGPRPDGTIQPEAAQRLREIGQWLANHGTTIYHPRRSDSPATVGCHHPARRYGVRAPAQVAGSVHHDSGNRRHRHARRFTRRRYRAVHPERGGSDTHPAGTAQSG